MSTSLYKYLYFSGITQYWLFSLKIVPDSIIKVAVKNKESNKSLVPVNTVKNIIISLVIVFFMKASCDLLKFNTTYLEK